MAHVIDYWEASHELVALVDWSAPPPTRAPLTPADTQLSESPPAFKLPASWPALLQLTTTLPEAVLTPAAQGLSSRYLGMFAGDPWAGTLHQLLPTDFDPFPWQVSAAVQYAQTKRLMLGDEPGCLVGETEVAINRARKGYKLSLKDLYLRFNGHEGRWRPDIPTKIQRAMPDGTIRLGEVTAVLDSGVQPVYKLVLDSGHTLTGTHDHPVLTPTGFVWLSKLTPGGCVAYKTGRSTTGNARSRKERKFYKDRYTKFHPRQRAAHWETGWRVPEHRLAMEAKMNGLTLDRFIEILNTDREQAADFLYLSPEQVVHHIDEDHTNNHPDNLEILTQDVHARGHSGVTNKNVLERWGYAQVVSVTLVGDRQTYDVAVADDPHNFLANDIVTHNTGKTYSAIMAIKEFHKVHPRGLPATTLVVCPASVVTPWIDAWQSLAPRYQVVRYQGANRTRDLYLELKHLNNPLVLVTSYETATRDVDKLLEQGIDHLIVDEHHYIKNPRSKRTAAVKKLAQSPDTGKILLSGTPITRHAGDLWTAVWCLWPTAFTSRDRFEARYLEKVPEEYGESVVGFLPHRRGEFDLALLGQQRRVAKADVLPWLPEKSYTIREVTIPPKWRKQYDSMRDHMVASLPDSDEPLAAMTVLNQITFLQAMAAAPCDVEVTEELTDEGDIVERYHTVMKPSSWKVSALMEVIEERPDDSIVVFSPSRQLVELAGEALTKADIPHGYIVGGQSDSARDAARTGFQNGDLRVILVTTGAGGTGITLTAANCAVFLSRPYALVDAMQAEDRLHRIGSEIHDSIDVIDVVAADSIDYRIRHALVVKGENLADVLKDPRVLKNVLGGTT